MEYLVGVGVGVVLLVSVIFLVVCYVLFAVSHRKALKALGYQSTWMAWIPYVWFYACADAVTGEEEDSVRLFGSLEVPAMVFKFWWIVSVILLFVSLNGTLENIITLVLNVVFLGNTYAKMYAKMENKQESETMLIGCVSGVIPLIAVVKFLAYKENR